MKRFFPLWMALSLLLCIFTAPYAAAGTITYIYDDAGRLVAADYANNKFIDYRYDRAGNLLSRIIGTAMAGNVYPDDSVGLKDAILALQTASRVYAQGLSTRGDVNGDRKIGLAEALYVLEVLGGIRE